MTKDEIAQCERDIALMRDAGHTHIPVSIAALEKIIAVLKGR